LHTLDGVSLPLEQIAETGNSSEIGLRFRSFITRRLFYGVEGNLLIGKGKESISHAGVLDSKERSRTTNATLGFGLGYALRPRTVFSFDVTGGLVRNRSMLYENATGSLLESERKRVYFLSLHAAVQTDVWRGLFVSGSILSLAQSNVTDLAIFSDSVGRPSISNGVFPSYARTRYRVTDYSTNLGIGWRFTPNFLAQYIFSTDFRQTSSARHIILLRYTFNTGKK
jgi:hypothetical protein